MVMTRGQRREEHLDRLLPSIKVRFHFGGIVRFIPDYNYMGGFVLEEDWCHPRGLTVDDFWLFARNNLGYGDREIHVSYKYPNQAFIDASVLSCERVLQNMLEGLGRDRTVDIIVECDEVVVTQTYREAKPVEEQTVLLLGWDEGPHGTQPSPTSSQPLPHDSPAQPHVSPAQAHVSPSPIQSPQIQMSPPQNECPPHPHVCPSHGTSNFDVINFDEVDWDREFQLASQKISSSAAPTLASENVEAKKQREGNEATDKVQEEKQTRGNEGTENVVESQQSRGSVPYENVQVEKQTGGNEGTDNVEECQQTRGNEATEKRGIVTTKSVKKGKRAACDQNSGQRRSKLPFRRPRQVCSSGSGGQNREGSGERSADRHSDGYEGDGDDGGRDDVTRNDVEGDDGDESDGDDSIHDEELSEFNESDDEIRDEFVEEAPEQQQNMADEVETEVMHNLVSGHSAPNRSHIDLNVEFDEDCESEYDISDVLHTADEDSEGCPSRKTFKKRNPQFNEHTGFHKEMELKLGMEFANPKVFRKALMYFSIFRGFDYKYVKNERVRVTAKCKNPRCTWHIHASWTQNREKFQDKVMRGEHNCGSQYYNTKVRSSWIASVYLMSFAQTKHGTFDADLFAEQVNKDYGVFVSRFQVYRARRLADEVIRGKNGDQYRQIWDYCEAMCKWNPRSSMKPEVHFGMFRRLYVGISCCIKGFLAGCRPFICLDACFLKSQYGGTLHVAVGLDANANMFPISWAVCETEGKRTWEWFLEHLIADIGEVSDKGWTFMSDQQKGLEQVLKDTYPTARDRVCVRHMYATFKRRGHTGQELKDLLWNAARATTEQRHKYFLTEISKLNFNAYGYLLGLDPELWTRSAFSPFPKCDILLNNIAETFNSFILQARDKPILTCLEMIRSMIMRRMYKKVEGINKYGGAICPRIQAKLEKLKLAANDCLIRAGGGERMQVEHCVHGMQVVDLVRRTCTCRNWDLTGVPCCHAIAAIRYDRRRTPEEMVAECYSTNMFKRIYAHIIEPMPGPQQWPVSTKAPIAPPTYTRQAGRPRKQRIRENDENPASSSRISKAGVTMTCGKCGNPGHNSRRCRGQPDPRRAAKMAMHAEKAKQRRAKKRATTSSQPSAQPVTASSQPSTTTISGSQQPCATQP